MLAMQDGKFLSVLFLDLDGTILKLQRLISNLKLAGAAAGLDPRQVDLFFHDVYHGLRPFGNNLREGARAAWGIDEGPRFLKFERTFHELEETLAYELVDGVTEKIEWVLNHGVKVGFLTSNRRKSHYKKLSSAGLDPGRFFAATADDRFVKPDQRALKEALKELRAEPQNVLHIGDSDVDYRVTRLRIDEERDIAFVNFVAVLSGVCGESTFLRLGVSFHRENHTKSF